MSFSFLVLVVINVLFGAMAEIFSKNETFRLEVGQRVLLPCDVREPEESIIQWYKRLQHGVVKLFSGTLRQTRDMRYNMNPSNYTLTIENLKKNDSGIFVCELLDEEPDTQIEHTLEVFDVVDSNGYDIVIYIVLAVMIVLVLCAAAVGAVSFIRKRRTQYLPANSPVAEVAFTKK